MQQDDSSESRISARNPRVTKLGRGWGIAAFLIISAVAVLGALIVKLHPIATGMWGPYAGAAAILLAFGTCLAALQSAASWKKSLAATGGLLVFAALVELSGIYTGFPFGAYDYTNLWWPSAHLVGGRIFPIFVPLAWYVIVTCCYALAAKRFRGFSALLCTAAFAAILDLALEPVMTGPVGFWTWRHYVRVYDAPIQNIFGWFLTAFCGALILALCGCAAVAKDTRPVVLLNSILVFTIAIGCIYTQWDCLIGVPILVGSVLFTRLAGRAE